MSAKIFFSWQSDTLDTNGKQFIEEALKQAIQFLSKLQKVDEEIEVDKPNRDHADEEVIEEAFDDSIDEDIELDKDTKNDTGSPPIFERVREKIDNCAVIVSDLTCVAQRRNGQIISNPNVLIEYGYAYHKLTWRRIIQVMNIAFGEPTLATMPFDMALHRLPIQYNLPNDATPQERDKELKKLARTLHRAIYNILTSDEYENSRPKPPKIEYRQPLQGQARFRYKGMALGIYTPPFPGLNPDEQETQIYLEEGPVLWFRFAPEQHLEKPLKLSEIEKYGAPLSLQPIFGRAGNIRLIRGADGRGCVHGTNGHMTSIVSFMFTDGEIWTINGFSLKSLPEYISIDEDALVASINKCLAVLRDLGIDFPLRMVIGIEDIGGRSLPLKSSLTSKSPSCQKPTIDKEGVVNTVEDIQQVYDLFFEELYEHCDMKRPPRQSAAKV